ncbi:MAG: T9SS type A sorting domain-containing protein [Bacteroidia bacterium]|nr:T9SS type A sorting domain-containing protein [Bacteroidia bacterium]
MKLFTVLSLAIILSFQGMHAQVTFTKDIAPIIYNNCTPCHRPGEIGPMPFTNYNEVMNWGGMIAYVTDINYMPPWKTDRNFSTFQGERFLTATQKQLIQDWVNAGMPQGNPNDEPALPTFPQGSQLGEPDLVISFSEAFQHKGNNKDQYQNFVLPTNLTEDKILKAIELRPGNSRIVHHSLFAMDTTGNARVLDSLSPEYGYDGFGGFVVDVADNFPGYVPGSKAFLYPNAIGQRIYKNSDIVVQMHYAPTSVAQSDSSTINLFFADSNEVINRQVMIEVMQPFSSRTSLGEPFSIPPNQVKTFHGTLFVPFDVSLMGIGPHMHLLGTGWEVFAVKPNGDTTNLISIPDWDFNWQGIYFYKNFQILEAGSIIHAYATYDNTSSNPLNPNNPPTRVSWGEGTSDEMYYLPILFVPTLPGDDTLSLEVALPPQKPQLIKYNSLTGVAGQIVDTSGFGSNTSNPTNIGAFDFPENKFYPIFPNPMHGPVDIGFSLAQGEKVSISLYSLDGKLIKDIVKNRFYPLGHHKAAFQSQRFSQGVYLIRVHGESVDMSQKIIIK